MARTSEDNRWLRGASQSALLGCPCGRFVPAVNLPRHGRFMVYFVANYVVIANPSCGCYYVEYVALESRARMSMATLRNFSP